MVDYEYQQQITTEGALVAGAVAKDSLPTYAHKFAPKTFTLHQLFACLILKRFFKTSYRGIEAYLKDMPAICQAIELRKVPHFTTLEQAERRLLKITHARHLLQQSNTLFDQGHKPPQQGRLAAADSTGLEAGHRSAYYTNRQKQSGERVIYRRFPKLTLLVDMQTHMVLSMLTSRDPKPDVQELCPLIDAVSPGILLHHVYADAGFDSEENHCYLRQEHGVLTTIPPWHGRPSDKPPQGRYQRMMKKTFHLRKTYGQRWQIETTNSMIKRNQGPALLARSYWSQQREMYLAVLIHNIAIVYVRKASIQNKNVPNAINLSCKAYVFKVFCMILFPWAGHSWVFILGTFDHTGLISAWAISVD